MAHAIKSKALGIRSTAVDCGSEQKCAELYGKVSKVPDWWQRLLTELQRPGGC